MKILRRRWWLAAAAAVAVAGSTVGAVVASAASTAAPATPGGLGQASGLLPRTHLTEESALQVDLNKETVRLPLYPGTAHGQRVWYVLLDASDPGLAHDLGVNYAPKLANIAIGDPAAVQTVTLTNPSPAQNPFGPGVVNFAGAPNFSPTRIAQPGPTGFPLAKFAPGSVAGPNSRHSGSPTGCGLQRADRRGRQRPVDVVHHTNTEDWVLGVHIVSKSSRASSPSRGRPAVRQGFDATTHFSVHRRRAADRGAERSTRARAEQRGLQRR